MNNQKSASNSLDLTQSSPNNSLIMTEILSITPGRIRIRVPSFSRHIDSINLIIVSLKNQLAIESVRSNFQIGSLTIFYNFQSLKAVEIFDKLRELGLSFSEKSTQSLIPIPHPSQTAIQVTQITKNVNQHIQQASNNIVDLRVLIPLSFGLLAWRQLILKGWQLETIPWYVLAWYAFDSFIKLQNTDQNSQTS
ncbi:hypothetical protein cce_2389 [Crocosphaera subtropica ATCC 51142]|uniref:HMA domain-containing protein n=1 Tax=Crocosphaera subtropica (strain ATCC 51142 / BH68) TaxID=43989 RepID=B1WQM7_CROS5|nr:hypothetical protein [Crocosphaera subtropica]ACB51738.1 hypothetical protein cce_2389 [Crocosphaera subtropica ATCC 51142]